MSPPEPAVRTEAVSEAEWTRLLAAARGAREHAHAPYSRFRVGAALLAEDGTVYTGCNVENRTLGLTLCAERVALGAAVAAGRQRFLAAAVVSSASPPAPPCGLCRESFIEFQRDLPIVIANGDGQRELVTLRELLPRPFVLPEQR